MRQRRPATILSGPPRCLFVRFERSESERLAACSTTFRAFPDWACPLELRGSVFRLLRVSSVPGWSPRCGRSDCGSSEPDRAVSWAQPRLRILSQGKQPAAGIRRLKRGPAAGAKPRDCRDAFAAPAGKKAAPFSGPPRTCLEPRAGSLRPSSPPLACPLLRRVCRRWQYGDRARGALPALAGNALPQRASPPAPPARREWSFRSRPSAWA